MTFGYLRETKEEAIKCRNNPINNVCRTGLDEYLSIIFPNTNDWVHDKIIPNCGRRCRPDYRSDSLKLIVEFDGVPHYTSPRQIIRDINNTSFYESLGYKVVRIPYFIQLSSKVVNKLFNIKINIELFDESQPSFDESLDCTPAFLCDSGVMRMAEEFIEISTEQLVVNYNYLKSHSYNLCRPDLLKSKLDKLNFNVV